MVKGGGVDALRDGSAFVYNKWLKFVEGAPEVGELVELIDPEGEFLGCGIFERVGPVGVRVLSFTKCFSSLYEAIYEKIMRAYELRKRLNYVKEGSYRLINSDGDLFSGLIVDVYNDIVVIQSSSQAVDKVMPTIVEVLVEILGKDITVYEKSVQRSRRDIGLEFAEKFHRGRKHRTIIVEGNSKFIVDVVKGQKTGFFLDQRDNRVKLEKYVCGSERVLDLFSYTGGFGIHAANAGAEHVTFVEEDPVALEILHENLKLNRARNYSVYGENVWNVLRKLLASREKYDAVIVDPPAFIQSMEGFRKGYEAYMKLYTLASQLVKENGIIFLSSCSFFLRREEFVKLIHKVLIKQYDYVILEVGRASKDHVLRYADKHLDYLKSSFIYLREMLGNKGKGNYWV